VFVFSDFRKWLVVRCHGDYRFGWSGIILSLAFPEGVRSVAKMELGSVPVPLLEDDENVLAIETFFRLFEEFLELREQPEELAKIDREYEIWSNDYYGKPS
jgi:hypothetical protein